MARRTWSDEFLNQMRKTADPDGDEMVRAILSPVEPKEVRTRLTDLVAALEALSGEGDDPASDIGEIRQRMREAQFFAGTSEILNDLKLADQAAEAGRVSLWYGDRAAFARFREVAVHALRQGLESLGVDDAETKRDPRTWYTADYKREAYNQLLVLSDYLAISPELLSAQNSDIAQRFAKYPAGFLDFFSPVEAPAWVDEAKLRMAVEVWEKNMPFVLLTLFSGSLPFCYLDRKGIPLLYETGKLTDSRYISQRLYETGLMLDSVLAADGMKVGHDVSHQRQQLDRAAKAENLQIRYTRQGRPMWHTLSDEEQIRLKTRLASAEDGVDPAKRFLTGRGVLYSKKVRILHAAMRRMALGNGHGHSVPPEDHGRSRECVFARMSAGGWNSEDGLPINQEDLAYTLLTFGYVIPMGLAKWGRAPSREETEAFLHRWKVVGHIMGVRDELLTDDLQESRELFESLLGRVRSEPRMAVATTAGADQGGDAGEQVTTSSAMTSAIVDFLNRYLPKRLHGLPAVMIMDQVGRQNAEILLGPGKPGSLFSRLVYRAVTSLSKIHSFLDRWIYQRSRLLETFFTHLMHDVGVAFVESWRGPFERRPFFLPEDLHRWKLEPGVDEAYVARLHRWRRKMFLLLVGGLVTLLGGSFVVAVGVAGSVLQGGIGFFEWSLLASLPLFGLAVLFMWTMVRRTLRQRPTQ